MNRIREKLETYIQLPKMRTYLHLADSGLHREMYTCIIGIYGLYNIQCIYTCTCTYTCRYLRHVRIYMKNYMYFT